jgi:hypothetical protein
MRARLLFAGVLALALLASGCSLLFDGSSHVQEEDDDVDGGVVDECADHEECIFDALEFPVCADRGDGNRCFAECQPDECDDHPYGEVCLPGGLCGCETVDDCPQAGFFCVDQLCSECRDDPDCPPTRPICDLGFCQE